jgi:hypothetical protein
VCTTSPGGHAARRRATGHGAHTARCHRAFASIECGTGAAAPVRTTIHKDFHAALPRQAWSSAIVPLTIQNKSGSPTGGVRALARG